LVQQCRILPEKIGTMVALQLFVYQIIFALFEGELGESLEDKINITS
jgi:hypothetical protein